MTRVAKREMKEERHQVVSFIHMTGNSAMQHHLLPRQREREGLDTDTELYLPRTLEPAALWEMHLRVIWPDGNRRRDK